MTTPAARRRAAPPRRTRPASLAVVAALPLADRPLRRRHADARRRLDADDPGLRLLRLEPWRRTRPSTGNLLALQRLPRRHRPADRQRRPRQRHPGRRRRVPRHLGEEAARRGRAPRAAQSITVGAGDLVGATPLVSAAFHDEPTIELMNALGLDISSVGNHEFDEGVDELSGSSSAAATRSTAARTATASPARLPVPGRERRQQEHRPADPAAVRHQVRRRRAGRLRRHDARGHAEHRQPGRHHRASTSTTRSRPPTCAAALLRLLGIKSLVLLIHEGGRRTPPAPQPSTAAPTSPARSPTIVAGPAAGVRRRGLRPHAPFYSCALPELRRRADGRHQRGQQRPAGHRHRLHARPPHRQVRRASRRTT